MIAPEFTPLETPAEDRITGDSASTVWRAEIGNGSHIRLLPRPAGGYEIIVTEPGFLGESYGVFPSLEVAFLEACVIYADTIENSL